MLRSGICHQAQLESEPFQGWATRMGERRLHLHRKVWEWCFIAQALQERGQLGPGRRGLGFAVGQEPLPALFASLGCQITATDQTTDAARSGGWVDAAMHAADRAELNRRALCPPKEFSERVEFRFVDMRAVPDDLSGFDFVWSACSLEHLGSLEAGEAFIFDALKCLRPGGIAVHTTEFNLSSEDETIGAGGLGDGRTWPTGLYRRQDIEGIGQRLRDECHAISLSFNLGAGKADWSVDRPPYQQQVHLRLELGEFVTTSYGLIIEKDGG